MSDDTKSDASVHQRQLLDVLFRQNRFQDILTLAQNSQTNNNPHHIPADLAAACALALNRHEEGCFYLKQMVQMSPCDGYAHFLLGNSLNKLRLFDQAEKHYLEAVRYAPNNFEVYNNYANFLHQQSRPSEAEAFYRRALNLCKTIPSLYNNFGAFLKSQQKLSEAEAYYLKAIELSPGYVDAHFNLANLYLETQQPIKAENYYFNVLRLDKHNHRAFNQLAMVYTELNKWVEAEQCYKAILEHKPSWPEGHYNYGKFLEIRNRFSEASEHYREALSLKPTYGEAYFHLGRLLDHDDKIDEARVLYLKALEWNPHDVNALNNLGLLYIQLKQWSHAEECLRKAVALKNNHSKICYNLSLLLLLLGHFKEGWSFYEARCDPTMEECLTTIPSLSFAQWRGENMKGKSLLVLHEQGYGDVIQFARYLALLKMKGAKHITVVCQKSLKTLFQTMKTADHVLSSDERDKITEHDYWTFIASIPQYFTTSIKSIPSLTPYFTIPLAREKKWDQLLPKKGFKVGLFWKGSLNKRNDQRSLASIETLHPLWSIPGVTFISLQKGHGEQEALSPSPHKPMLHLGSDIQDFLDTAALIKNLDLLICVDTAIAHLAGALGKSVWVLLPYVADWRWMMEGSDSPWYPSMRLFRQKQRGQWNPVVDLVRNELKKAVASPLKHK